MKKAFKYIGLLFGLFVVYVVGTITITLTIDEVLYRRTLERCMQDYAFPIDVFEDAGVPLITPEETCREYRRRSHYPAQ